MRDSETSLNGKLRPESAYSEGNSGNQFLQDESILVWPNMYLDVHRALHVGTIMLSMLAVSHHVFSLNVSYQYNCIRTGPAVSP